MAAHAGGVCLTCNSPDGGDRSVKRCPDRGESWTTNVHRAMQNWIALIIRLRWCSGGILLDLIARHTSDALVSALMEGSPGNDDSNDVIECEHVENNVYWL